MLPYYFKKHKIDIFFSPELYISERTSIPQIAVFHDINYIHKPELVKGWGGNYMRKKTPKFAHKASKILTVSEFSAKDIENTFQIPTKKLDVCYNGISDVFYKKETPSPTKHPFFLVFGAINPRKNICNIFRAFDAFKKEDTDKHKLIFIGKKMCWTPEMDQTLNAMHFKDSVHFLGRQSDETACNYLNHAQALVYTSLYEGFGLPIIEAQQCGCPIITSNTSCLPEISGNAGIMVDPLNIYEIINALKSFQKDSDNAIRIDYIAKGFENAKRFKWSEVANKINQTIDSILC